MCGNNQKIIIQDGFSCSGVTFYLKEEAAEVEIGKNCMFSFGIDVWATDGHAIMNCNEEKAYNLPRPIKIASHVWVGSCVKILKGTEVAQDSILPLGSIVSGDFSKKTNVILAGNPTKIIKQNINWNRDKTAFDYNKELTIT